MVDNKEAPIGDLADDSAEGAPKSPSKATVGKRGEEAGTGIVYKTKTDNPNKKIVYIFKYRIETLDFGKTEEALMRAIKETNSYLSDMGVEHNYGRKEGNYIARVPKEASEEFQEKIAKVGTVTSHSLSSDDMTQHYRDVESDKEVTEIKEEIKEAVKPEDVPVEIAQEYFDKKEE